MMLDPQKIYAALEASLPAYGRVENDEFAHTRNCDGSINLICRSTAVMLLTSEKLIVNIVENICTMLLRRAPHMYRPLEVLSVRKQKDSPPLARLRVDKDIFTVPVGGTVEITRSGITCTPYKVRTPNKQRARAAVEQVTDFFVGVVLTHKLSSGTKNPKWCSDNDVIEAVAKNDGPSIDAAGWCPLYNLMQKPNASAEDIAHFSKQFVANNQYKLFSRLGVYEPDP